MKRTSLHLTLVALLCVIAVPMAFGSGFTFSKGDIVVGVGQGQYKVFSPTGVLETTLNTGSGASEDTGGAFDSAGNLYVTNFSRQSVTKFDIHGNVVQTISGMFNADPESITFDKAGNFYVGQADGNHDVLKFNSAGTLIDTFDAGTQNRGTDWIDLAADQHTLFSTSEDGGVLRYDLTTRTQLSNFANLVPMGCGTAYALRILGDGSVLVACTNKAVLLDSNGNLVRSYTAPNLNAAFALNVLPDGLSFLTANINSTGEIFQFNIATGALEQTIFPNPFVDVAGLIVFGEQVTGGTPPGTAPEPASLLLCGGGLAALVYKFRKQK